MVDTNLLDKKGLSIDEAQWVNGNGNPNWEPTPARQAELAAMGFTKGYNPRAAAAPFTETLYINDPGNSQHGQQVYQDSNGNYFTEGVGGSGRVLYGKTLPGNTSTTPPSTTPQQPAVNSNGNLTGNETSGSVAAPPTQPTTPGQTPGQTTTPTPTQLTPEQQAAQAANQQKLDQLLANPNLTADQKQAIQAIYGAVSNNDLAQADKIKAAIAAATEYSDPYFKAQTRLVLDALDRSFQAADDDLAFKESSLQKSLQALIQDITASKDYLSFQEQMELKALQRNMEQQLDTTQQDMAARGFSSSSIRSRAEGLINETYTDMRESSSRSFLEQANALDRNLATQQQTTQDQIAYYRNLAAQSKTDALRAAEQQVGTTGLQNAGYTDNLVGGVGGAIPEAQTKDSLAFASQFAF